MENIKVLIFCQVMQSNEYLIFIQKSNIILQVVGILLRHFPQIMLILYRLFVRKEPNHRVIIRPLPHSFEIIRFLCDSKLEIELVLANK